MPVNAGNTIANTIKKSSLLRKLPLKKLLPCSASNAVLPKKNSTSELARMITITTSAFTPRLAPRIRIRAARTSMAGMLIAWRGRSRPWFAAIQSKKNSNASVKAIT